MSNEEDKVNQEELEAEETTSELEQEEVEQVESTEEQEETKSDIKGKAKSTGHLSLEEFVAKGGKPEDYKTEKEFVLTGELIELKKTVQKRDQDIEEILKYQKNVIATQKQKAREEINRALAEAKANADVDAVEKLTTQKSQAEQQDLRDQLQVINDDISQADQVFLNNNKTWYNDNNPELKQRALELGTYYKAQFPGLPYREMAQKIEKQMRFEISQNDAYKHLLADTNTSRPNLSAGASAVAQSGSVVTQGAEGKLYAKLTPNEKAMYAVHKRIAKKLGDDVSVSEFVKELRKNEEV